MKSVLCKMVPYASFPYADHILRQMGAAPNSPAVAAEHTQTLIDAAHKLKELIANMERLEEITGFIVYKDEEVKQKPEQISGEKELKKQESEVQAMTEEVAEMMQKYEGKVLKEFIPCFLLEQHKEDKWIEFESFDNCVDEYFSQAEKYKEKTKIESKENAIWQKMHRIQEDQTKRIEGL